MTAPATSTVDPHQLHDRLVRAGSEWADKEAAATLLEETRKSLLAHVTLRFLKGSSFAAAENAARATEEYTDHVQAMVEARRQANQARVKYETAKVYVDLLRTQSATRRAEMQTLGVLP